MKNSKLPWRKTPGNRPSHFQCADGYNIGSVNSAATTEGEANLNLVIKAVNEHAALVAVAEAADKVIKVSNFLLEAQRQGDDDAMAHAHIALYAELDNLSTIRNSNK